MIVVDDEIVTGEELSFFDERIVKNAHFPVFYTEATSKLTPFFSHNILGRKKDTKEPQDFSVVPLSTSFDLFDNIVTRFCNKHSIEKIAYLRGCVNVTFEKSSYEFGDPHIDYANLQHLVLIIYLNEVIDGSTIVFENKHDGKNDDFIIEDYGFDFIKNNFKIKMEVKPKRGRILCFDGSHYHAMRWPKPTELRYITVFNIHTKL